MSQARATAREVRVPGLSPANRVAMWAHGGLARTGSRRTIAGTANVATYGFSAAKDSFCAEKGDFATRMDSVSVGKDSR